MTCPAKLVRWVCLKEKGKRECLFLVFFPHLEISTIKSKNFLAFRIRRPVRGDARRGSHREGIRADVRRRADLGLRFEDNRRGRDPRRGALLLRVGVILFFISFLLLFSFISRA